VFLAGWVDVDGETVRLWSRERMWHAREYGEFVHCYSDGRDQKAPRLAYRANTISSTTLHGKHVPPVSVL
jgi:hypothetical protein